MDPNKNIKRTFKIKNIYILIMFVISMVAFTFMRLDSVSGADDVGILLPKIDGVEFYRVYEDGNSVLIDISYSSKRIFMPNNNSINLKVKIDDDKYYSGVQEKDRDEVKSAFSVSGNIILSDRSLTGDTLPGFDGEFWNLRIQSMDKDDEKNALNLNLRQRDDIFLNFPNADGIKFFSLDSPNKDLNGQIQRAKAGKSFSFGVEVDKNIVNVTNLDNFELISTGDNIYKVADKTESGNKVTYRVEIEEVLSDTNVSITNLVSIEFPAIDGMTYYNAIDNSKIENNSSRLFSSGSSFTFIIEIDSLVSLENVNQIEFTAGDNEISTNKINDRKYEITLSDIKFSFSVGSEQFLRITFPDFEGVTYSKSSSSFEANKIEKGGHATVVLGSIATFYAKIDSNSALASLNDLEFKAGKNKVETSKVGSYQKITITGEESVAGEIKDVGAKESADVIFNYCVIKFGDYEGIQYYRSYNGTNATDQINKSDYNKGIAVKELGDLEFYIKVDTNVIKIDDDVRGMSVLAGNNRSITVTRMGTSDVFKTTLRSVSYSATIEIEGAKGINFGNAQNIEIFKADDYGQPITGTGISGLQKFLAGSKYNIVAKIPASILPLVGTGSDQYDPKGELRFSIGEKNVAEINKFYEEGGYVCYVIALNINDNGAFTIQNGYTARFEELPEGIGYSKTYDYAVIGRTDYEFSLSKGSFGTKILLNDTEVDVPSTTQKVTIPNKSNPGDVTIKGVSRKITIPNIDGVVFKDSSGNVLTGEVETAYGYTKVFMVTIDPNKVQVGNSAASIKFSAGENTVSTTYKSSYTYEVKVKFEYDAEISFAKTLSFPDIYNVNFYEYENTEGQKYTLGDEIVSGTNRAVLAGTVFKFIVEVDESIDGAENSKFSVVTKNGGTQENQFTFSYVNDDNFSGGKTGKIYFLMEITSVLYDADVISDNIFTIDLPILQDIYYYKTMDENGAFSDPISDYRITINKDNAAGYTFYIDGTNENNVKSSDTDKLKIDKIDSGNNCTKVSVIKISESSSISITKETSFVNVIMPESHDVLKSLQYLDSSESKYKDGLSLSTNVEYGKPLKLRFSFNRDVVGYSNLYKTEAKNITVKAYDMSGLENGADVKEKGVVLEVLKLRNNVDNSKLFITPDDEYETDIYYPTKDTILMIDGVKEDVYDLSLVAGEDNEFIDASKVSINDIIKIFKVDDKTKEEIIVPYSGFELAYIIRDVPYKQSAKFKYYFTDGAKEEGIKYNLSDIKMSQNPYEGDSGELTPDGKGIYTATIKSKTIIEISGIKANQYDINIPKSPAVILKYVVNQEGSVPDSMWVTAEGKFSVSHGSKVRMKISSDEPKKPYIKKITAEDTTNGTDPVTLYDKLADQTEVEVSIEGVVGNTDLSITVSQIEYELKFVLMEFDETGEGREIYPDIDKMIIYDDATNYPINATSTGGYASRIVRGNDDFSFRLTPDYKYNKSDLVVSYKNESSDSASSTMITPNNGVYDLKKVSDSGRIIISGLKINEYDVEFPQPSEEINFHEITEKKLENGVIEEEESVLPLNGVKRVRHGETIMFKPRINSGYALAGDSVKANDEPIKLINGRYVLSNISNDIKINVSPLDEMEYTITFPNDIKGIRFTDGFGSTISSEKKKYGESFSFKIAVEENYSYSEDNMVVYDIPADVDWSSPGFSPSDPNIDSKRIKKDSSGNYKLSSIARDSVILVDNIKINQYSIDLPLSQEGVIFKIRVKEESGNVVETEVTEDNKSQISVVDYGENFIFSAQAKEGYDVSQMKLMATIQNSTQEVEVEKMSTGYILQNVTNNMAIKVSNVTLIQHTVTLSGDNMIFKLDPEAPETIKGGKVARESGNFQFYIIPGENYQFSEGGLSIDINPFGGAVVSWEKDENGILNGAVTVQEVMQDVTLNISGVELKKVTVTLPTETEGISFMSVEDESSYLGEDEFILKSENIIPMGSEFRFHIKANPGYDISNILVSTGPGVYLYPYNGIYTITDTLRDVQVEVSNVQYAKYTVKLRGENMTFYEPNGLFPQSDFEISYLGETKFRIVMNTGYEADLEKEISFSANNKDIIMGSTTGSGVYVSTPDENGIFTISNIKADTVINVSGAKKKKYNLNFPTDLIGAKLKTPEGELLEATMQAEYLSDFKFEIVADKGYKTDSAMVQIEPPENGIVSVIDGGYTIGSITGNINVSIEGIEPEEYNINYKGVGADFYSVEGMPINSSTVKYKESFSFSIKAKEGYSLLKGYTLSIVNESGDKATIVFSSDTESDTEAKLKDQTVISETERFTYTVSNVQGNLTVLMESVGKNEYSILFPTSVNGVKFLNEEGQTITSGTALYGGDFIFKVVAEEGYDISNIVVTADLQSIDLTDGKYTIENITEDIDVNVSGVVSTKVYVNLKYVSGVIFKDLEDNEISTLEKIWIDYGGSYSFKVALEESYMQSEESMKVIASPETSNLSFERGIYTLTNVTENTDVMVSNVNLNTYGINLAEVKGVTYKDSYGISEIKGVQTVSHGQDFKFIVNPADGYILSDIEVSAKGKEGDRIALTPVDGVYTIPNVTMDYTVVVDNAQKSVYTVEIRTSEGSTLQDVGGNTMASRQSVKHGDSLVFRLSIDTAYNKSVPLVTVKGRSQPITPENNIYTVANITGDTIVEVTNVKKNTYKVTFKPTEGVIYRTDKSKDFSGYLEVEYGGTLNFKVALKDEYDASQITVLLDGDKALASNGGMYQIVSVGSDCEISVKYVEKNTEESVIEMIASLPDEIVTSEDAAKVVSVSRAYNELPEENQKLVTNLSKLKILQTETSDVHHESNDVEVSGLDWNIRVDVTPLDGDPTSVKRLNDKMERKTIISHYEISLVNSLTGDKYEPAEDQKVSVVLPLNMPEGYMNTVIVHEKESGSIEYLDVLISNGYAKFETSSFSIFGVAAKKIPNYVEDTNDVTVSLAGLTDNEEETKRQILGEELSSILDDSLNMDTTQQDDTKTNSNSGKIVDSTKGSFVDRALNWILNNELLITAIIIAIFAIWIFIILSRGGQKKSS